MEYRYTKMDIVAAEACVAAVAPTSQICSFSICWISTPCGLAIDEIHNSSERLR